MAMFQGSKQERIEELETELASANEQIETLSHAQEELVTAREELTAAKEQNETLTEQNETLTSELEAVNKSLSEANEKLETFDAEADKRAIEIVASNSHETPVKETSEDAQDDVLAKFNSLKGSDATEFFAKNQDAIRAARMKSK